VTSSYRNNPRGQSSLPTKAPPAPFWKLTLLWLADEVASFAGHTSRLQRIRSRAARNYRDRFEEREEQRYQAERRKYLVDVDKWEREPAPRRQYPMPPMRGGWHLPHWFNSRGER
jgi:hypothetical protein